MQRLTPAYYPDDDWHGELVAYVQSEDFTGKSAAWFRIEQLTAFSDSLRAFPIVPQAAPTLGGGFWKNDDELEQAHVMIRIEPVGPQGKLRVNILLATPSWDMAQADQHSVHARFLVNYADLDAFQRDFSALLNRDTEEACLEATPT
jgi:hypothetical protein